MLRSKQKGITLKCGEKGGYLDYFTRLVDPTAVSSFIRGKNCLGEEAVLFARLNGGEKNNLWAEELSQQLELGNIDLESANRLRKNATINVKPTGVKEIDPVTMLDDLLSQKRAKISLEKLIFEDQTRLEKLPRIRNPILKELIEIAMAIKSSNIAWAKTVINRLLSSDFNRVIFTPVTTRPDRKKLDQILLRLFRLIERHVDDPILVRGLGLYFEYNMYPGDLPQFYQHISRNDSLNSIRELIRGRLGRLFPALCFTILNGQKRFAEARIYLHRALELPHLKKLQTGELQLLAYYLPSSEQARAVLQQKLHTLITTKSYYNQYLILELIESNLVIKKMLEQMDSRFRQPIYNLKRSFFHQLASQGIAPVFTLLNLTLLGDQDRWLLWQMTR